MIQLRQASGDDVSFIVNAESHPDNRLYIGSWSVDEHTKALTDPNTQQLIIEQASEPVGYAILTDLQHPDDSVLLKRFVINVKGKGYGRAALLAIINYVFTELNAHRLWLDVRDFNERAEHLYQSVGFRFEGQLVEASKMEKGYCDLKLYAMLAQEFQALRQ